MLRNLSRACALLIASIVLAHPVAANPQLAAIADARVNMEPQAPFAMRGSGMPHDHEVTVYLPASYQAQPNQTYPVLWVLDAPLLLRAVVGVQDTLVLGNMAPEVIIVAVGSPTEEGLAGVGRRVMDFSPPGPDYFPRGHRGETWQELAPLPEFPHLANEFLAFLVDELRPRIAEQYRLSGEHVLFGHSAGGMFAAHSLFMRPDAFDGMIIGSPYLEGVRGSAFDSETQYSQEHDDLDVMVFIGVGADETQEYFLAASGIVSSTAALSETLRIRRYPSLQLETRIYEGENHYTVAPRVISDGIRFIWADEANELPSSWPQPLR